MHATTNVFSNALFNRESLEAYLRTKGLENRLVRVLGLFYERPLGLTQDDAAAEFGRLTQTMSPIFTDLLKHGMIMRKPIPGSEGDYETRPTRSKTLAGVCVLSPDWQAAAADYKARKRMEKQMAKAEKAALLENVALREIIADLIAVIEERFESPDADLREAIAVIRKEYSL